MKSLRRTRENERFRGSFSESDREVKRRRKVFWRELEENENQLKEEKEQSRDGDELMSFLTYFC